MIRRFSDVLNAASVVTTTRKTRGDDIEAACGQLAGDVRDRTGVAPRMAQRRRIMMHQVGDGASQAQEG